MPPPSRPPPGEVVHDVAATFGSLDADDAPLADLHLVCAGGEVVRAHSQLVGAFASAVAAAAGAPGAPRPLVLDVAPATAADARALRAFCYRGRAALTPATAPGLTALAARLGVPALAAAVEAAATGAFLSAASAPAYLLIGAREGAAAVEAAARAYVLRHAAACLGERSFLELDARTLASVLRDDALSAREEDVFRAVLRWAAARGDAAAAAAAAAGGDAAAAAAAHAAARAAGLAAALPHVRFPAMGAHVFARAVMPARVLSGEDANAVLMSYVAPDVAAPLLRFKAAPRAGEGSLYTWAPDAAAAAGNVGLSRDRCVAEWRAAGGGGGPPGAAPGERRPTMLVSQQAFSAGASTIYVTTWGCAGATVGVVASEAPDDEGDPARAVAARAAPDSPAFEGVTLFAAPVPRGGTPDPDAVAAAAAAAAGPPGSPAAAIATVRALFAPPPPAYTPHAHVARADVARTPAAAVAAAQPVLRDGSALVLALDCDVRELAVSVWHRGDARPTRLAVLRGLPARPLRVALAAAAYASGGDVDGIAVISSRAPAYLAAAARQAPAPLSPAAAAAVEAASAAADAAASAGPPAPTLASPARAPPAASAPPAPPSEPTAPTGSLTSSPAPSGPSGPTATAGTSTSSPAPPASPAAPSGAALADALAAVTTTEQAGAAATAVVDGAGDAEGSAAATSGEVGAAEAAAAPDVAAPPPGAAHEPAAAASVPSEPASAPASALAASSEEPAPERAASVDAAAAEAAAAVVAAAAAAADKPKVAVPSMGWACPVCSHSNRGRDDECSACGSPRS